MKMEEAEKKYGKEMLEKMKKTGYLSGITVSLCEDGSFDIPERDFAVAYKAAQGKKIHPFEWD